jgi:NAD(P)-dependent dehydrogenase (short-subunit alcohol dehydrogenase family)
MRVVVSDINGEAGNRVAGELRAKGADALAVSTDVADRASVEALADAVYKEFGAVHVVHNNAGVAVFARLDETTDDDWKWILDVNLQGVINGIQTFLPRIEAQGGEAHIVNTASLAGMIAGPGAGAYNASKFAVVAISETLRYELAPRGIGVSVLCPGGVNTNIFRTASARRPVDGDRPSTRVDLGDMRMIEPMEVGRMVRHGIETNDPYIFTHPELRSTVRHRFDRIMDGFTRAEERDAQASASSR